MIPAPLSLSPLSLHTHDCEEWLTSACDFQLSLSSLNGETERGHVEEVQNLGVSLLFTEHPAPNTMTPAYWAMYCPPNAFLFFLITGLLHMLLPLPGTLSLAFSQASSSILQEAIDGGFTFSRRSFCFHFTGATAPCAYFYNGTNHFAFEYLSSDPFLSLDFIWFIVTPLAPNIVLDIY